MSLLQAAARGKGALKTEKRHCVAWALIALHQRDASILLLSDHRTAEPKEFGSKEGALNFCPNID
jgi:hypothetical protein